VTRPDVPANEAEATPVYPIYPGILGTIPATAVATGAVYDCYYYPYYGCGNPWGYGGFGLGYFYFNPFGWKLRGLCLGLRRRWRRQQLRRAADGQHPPQGETQQRRPSTSTATTPGPWTTSTTRSRNCRLPRQAPDRDLRTRLPAVGHRDRRPRLRHHQLPGPTGAIRSCIARGGPTSRHLAPRATSPGAFSSAGRCARLRSCRPSTTRCSAPACSRAGICSSGGSVVPAPAPAIHADLNGLFALAIAAGYLLPYRDPDRYRAYLWIMGPMLKGAGRCCSRPITCCADRPRPTCCLRSPMAGLRSSRCGGCSRRANANSALSIPPRPRPEICMFQRRSGGGFTTRSRGPRVRRTQGCETGPVQSCGWSA